MEPGEAKTGIKRGVILPSEEPVEAQLFQRPGLNTFKAEYTRKGDDIIYHLFRKTQTAWPVGFEHRIWDTFLAHFRLKGREGQLTVEWIPEVFSWFIRVDGVGEFTTPTAEFLEAPLRDLDHQVS